MIFCTYNMFMTQIAEDISAQNYFLSGKVWKIEALE
jgi:hypothetical protein